MRYIALRKIVRTPPLVKFLHDLWNSHIAQKLCDLSVHNECLASAKHDIDPQSPSIYRWALHFEG